MDKQNEKLVSEGEWLSSERQDDSLFSPFVFVPHRIPTS